MEVLDTVISRIEQKYPSGRFASDAPLKTNKHKTVKAAILLANSIPGSKLLVFTIRGVMAHLLAHQRPEFAPIFAFTPNLHVSRTLVTARGVNPFVLQFTEGDPEAAPSTKPHKVEWEASRRVKGWLVPIPVGYAAISPLYAPGTVRNVRDNTVPVRMVESVLTMGEWVSPHRITQLAQLLWYPSPGNGQSALYRYHNDYSAPSAVTALSTNNILN